MACSMAASGAVSSYRSSSSWRQQHQRSAYARGNGIDSVAWRNSVALRMAYGHQCKQRSGVVKAAKQISGAIGAQ